MESVLTPSPLHFFTEIYPNKTLNLFFGDQLPDSTTTKNMDMINRLENNKKQNKQQRRQTLPAFSRTTENNCVNDDQDKDLVSKRYQRWSWTAASTVLPMETIQEEDE